MARRLMTTVLAAIALYSPVALAGVYTDDMSKCLVKSSDDKDQLVLVQWMFAAMSLHPAVQPMSTITPEQRDGFNRKAAMLMQRLLVENCRNETIAALKYEGTGAMGASFTVLGQVAGRSLMGDPHTAEALQGLVKYVDKDKTAELFRAAGLPAAAK